MTSAVIGFDIEDTRRLADALELPLDPLPALPPAGAVELRDWAPAVGPSIEAAVAAVAGGEPLDRAVVCTWADVGAAPLVDVAPERWTTDVELRLALWYRVLVALADRCRDGASIAVVAERPAPIDAAGHALTTAVSEGLATLTRSLALVHGERGVRANLVATELSTAPEVLLGLAPPLATFPGTIESTVAGAVRMVLSSDAAGVSGTVVRADCGRSW